MTPAFSEMIDLLVSRSGYRLVSKSKIEIIIVAQNGTPIRIQPPVGDRVTISIQGFAMNQLVALDAGIINALTSRQPTTLPEYIYSVSWCPEQWRSDPIMYMNLRGTVQLNIETLADSLSLLFTELIWVIDTINAGKHQIAKHLTNKPGERHAN